MIDKKNIFFLILFLFFTLKIYSQEDTLEILGEEKVGMASYYHMPGGKTASGETMKKEGYTCAHPTYPFGTMLQVTNLTTKKSVIVRVADRGPFSGKRILDLSLEAARIIGMLHVGIARVKATVVGDSGQVFLLPEEEAPAIDYGFKASSKKNPMPLVIPKSKKIKAAKAKSKQQIKVKAKRKNRRKK